MTPLIIPTTPMIHSFFYAFIFYCTCLTFADDAIVGIDLGAENVVTGLIGENHNLEVLQSRNGKRKLPSLITFDGIRRYALEDSHGKVYVFANNSFFFIYYYIHSLL